METTGSTSAVTAIEVQSAAASHQRDHELIAAFKAGDDDAFSDLVLKYEQRVFNHCLRMVRHEQESQDLTQEVFIKVYRSIRSYEHTYAFYTWLYRITVNCCIDHVRKKRRHAPLVSLSPAPPGSPADSVRERALPDERYVPEQQMLNRELNAVLQQAIAQLSPKLKEIIVAKEIWGLSYQEIAQNLNCSRGTVKSRLFRARERLKELLAPYMAG